MARGKRRLGIVRSRSGENGERWYIDFGRKAEPRMLYTFRGIRLDTEEMARSILGHIEVEVAGGRDLADVLSEFIPEADKRAGIEPFVRKWLETFERKVRIGDRQPRTLVERQRWAANEGNSNWFAWWYNKSIFEIDEVTLEDWSLWMAEQGLGGKTRWNVMSGFSSFLTWLSKHRRTFERPPIPWPEKDDPLPKVLSRDVQTRVIDAVPEAKRGIYLAMADCLIRPSEARVVRIRDWRGDELQIVRAAKDRRVGGVVRGLKRRGGDKVLPVSPRLREWLETHVSPERRMADPDGPLFANPAAEFNGWWSETALRRVWYFACTRAGVEKIGVYAGTKHSTATALKAAGSDDRVLATLMGHSDVRSVERYAHVQTQVIRSTLAILDCVSSVSPADTK
jgi:integrase/recombinase XerD